LVLNRAVFAFRTAFSLDPEKTLQTAFAVLRSRVNLSPTDKVVVISDVLATQRVDAIQIRTLEPVIVSAQRGDEELDRD
jgi:pyruvate kinase